MRHATALAILVSVLGPASSQPVPASDVIDVRVTEQIVYGQALVGQPVPGNVDLLLDLYEPVTRSARRRPALVLIHGGGFMQGSRNQPELVRIARGLAARGIVVASIDYRLIPQDPVPSARVAPAAAVVPLGVPLYKTMVTAIDDTLTALDWLRAHAKELRIHRNRLGIAGGSAGAITADHVAYALDDLGVRAPRFRFVGDLWGGMLIPPNPSLEAAADQLARGEAALFAVHSSRDGTVPVQLDDWLVARATAVGVPVEYHRIEGDGHGYIDIDFFGRKVAPGQTAFDRMLDFAEAALGPRRLRSPRSVAAAPLVAGGWRVRAVQWLVRLLAWEPGKAQRKSASGEPR